MRKLIVNADDFGFNKEVTDGIIQCHQNGCVTSTTLMANMPAAEYAAQQAARLPELSVGIHFVLSNGKALSDPKKIPALIRPDGIFRDASDIIKLAKHFQLPVEQVELEFTNQIERVLQLGITPTHCDSHHNVTVNPQPFIAMMRVVKKYNIRRLRTYRGLYRLDITDGCKLSNVLKAIHINTVRAPKSVYYEILHRYLQLRGYRLPCTKYGFYKVISSSALSYDLTSWAVLLKSLPNGISEFVSHPGLASDDPFDDPEYREKRVIQYELFSDPKTKELCEQFDIELVNFEAV